MAESVKPIDDIAAELRSAYPELDAVRAASSGTAYLVGGAVRDLLLERARSDIDLVVIGDAAALAAELGSEISQHERFATVKARLDDHTLDIATARAEHYPRPGALPEVRPAAGIAADLRRRDFTINAMAVPLQGEPELIDPYGGRADLEAGVLRVLHDRSFVDDPTRALRAARYAARFDFEPEPRTAALLHAADLRTVSADRRDADLLRLAAEENATRGFELLTEWSLLQPQPGGIELARAVDQLVSEPPWRGLAPRERVILAAVIGPPAAVAELAAALPESPSHAVELARGHAPVVLTLARAQGAVWLDRYLSEWRHVKLEIDGEDLLAAGVPQGPAVGRGLRAALRRKLNGEISGREAELAVALEAAQEGGDAVA